MPKTPGSFKKGNKPWNHRVGFRHCDPVLVPTEIDIAWAAGIYEGEGTCQARFCVRKNGSDYWAINCNVSQKDSWLCPKLRDLFGGGVTTFQVRNRENLATYYRWNLYGFRCVDFLKLIYKYLSPRRQKQVDAVLGAALRSEGHGSTIQSHGGGSADENFLLAAHLKAIQLGGCAVEPLC